MFIFLRTKVKVFHVFLYESIRIYVPLALVHFVKPFRYENAKTIYALMVDVYPYVVDHWGIQIMIEQTMLPHK